jgi:ADP-ribose pyrophosphatase
MERPAKAPPIAPHPLLDVESDEVVWRGRFPLQRVVFRFRRFDGAWSGALTWELWRRGGAVCVLPYDPWRDAVGLIEQFRLPALAAGLDPMMIEAPAGLLEPGEDVAEAGARETREETGLAPDRFEEVGRFLLMQGGCDEQCSFAIGRVRIPENATEQHGLGSEHEATRLVVMPAEEAFAMLAANQIRNAPTALVLLHLQLHRARLREAWMG